MNKIYQHYQIDLSGNNNFVQYNTVQGDGNGVRGFEIELTEKSKPYTINTDVEVFIAGTKPDTKQIFNSCEVTEQGTILVDVTAQMSAVAGRGYYQIVLISKTTNKQLKSFPFIIYVKESAFHAGTIISSDEFHALNGMVNKIESTLNKTDLVDSMLESSSKILDDTTAAYDNAVKSLKKAQNAIDTAESINSTARESADNAKKSEENSALYSDTAKSYAVGTDNEIRENDSVDNAKYYKEQAASSSASAMQSANLAGQKADDASASETNAQQYAANASASETNAKESADNAKISEENAAQSSSDAAQSATNSENSATKSAQSAENALESATNAAGSELSAKTYAENAENSAQRAEEIVGITIATEEKAGIVKPDGITITITEDGTIHGADTVKVDGQTIEKSENDIIKVSDSVLNRFDHLSTANDELNEFVNARVDSIWDEFGAVDNKIEKLNYNIETTFDEETERTNIVSGEKLSNILGKIKKWFSDLKTVAFTGSYNDLTNKPAIPTVPPSLPANGGNADTVDGFHASQTRNAGNTCVVRDGNGFTQLNYINSNTGRDENGVVSQIITTNDTDDYYRKVSLEHLKSQLNVNKGDVGLGNVTNTEQMPLNYWHWDGQSGQPSWLWGGNDYNNYYVYNPANFNVNRANALTYQSFGSFAEITAESLSKTVSIFYSGADPNAPETDSNVYWWNVFQFGEANRLTQIASGAYHHMKRGIYVRTKHDANWSNWSYIPSQSEIGNTNMKQFTIQFAQGGAGTFTSEIPLTGKGFSQPPVVSFRGTNGNAGYYFDILDCSVNRVLVRVERRYGSGNDSDAFIAYMTGI